MNERPEAVDIIVEKKKDYWRASTIQMVDRWTPDPDRNPEFVAGTQAKALVHCLHKAADTLTKAGYEPHDVHLTIVDEKGVCMPTPVSRVSRLMVAWGEESDSWCRLTGWYTKEEQEQRADRCFQTAAVFCALAAHGHTILMGAWEKVNYAVEKKF